jgi:hypothetical protein
MAEAVSILGYAAPYHFSSIFANIKDADLWKETFAMKERARRTGQDDVKQWRALFDQLLGHSSAITDVPAICFWRELLAAYPEAKVVLVERDVDKWLLSFGILVEGSLNPLGRYVLRYTDPKWYARIYDTACGWAKELVGTTTIPETKAKAREAYLQHYAEIRAAVPKERLLDYRLGSGWAPLCEFLGKDIPKQEFPHRNEAKTLEVSFSSFFSKSLKASLFNVSMAVLSLAVVGRLAWPLIRN